MINNDEDLDDFFEAHKSSGIQEVQPLLPLTGGMPRFEELPKLISFPHGEFLPSREDVTPVRGRQPQPTLGF